MKATQEMYDLVDPVVPELCEKLMADGSSEPIRAYMQGYLDALHTFDLSREDTIQILEREKELNTALKHGLWIITQALPVSVVAGVESMLATKQ